MDRKCFLICSLSSSCNREQTNRLGKEQFWPIPILFVSFVPFLFEGKCIYSQRGPEENNETISCLMMSLLMNFLSSVGLDFLNPSLNFRVGGSAVQKLQAASEFEMLSAVNMILYCPSFSLQCG